MGLNEDDTQDEKQKQSDGDSLIQQPQTREIPCLGAESRNTPSACAEDSNAGVLSKKHFQDPEVQATNEDPSSDVVEDDLEPLYDNPGAPQDSAYPAPGESETRPGAVPVRPSHRVDDSSSSLLDDDDEEVHVVESEETHRGPNETEDQYLVQATLVPNEEHVDIVEAKLVQSSSRLSNVWFSILIVAVTGLVVGLTVGLTQNKGGPQSVVTAIRSPVTEAPTRPPPDPTAVEVFRNTLPQYTLVEISKNVTTAQSRAFEWLTSDPNFEDYSLARQTRRFALSVLYYATNGNEWVRNDGWLSDEHECNWYMDPEFFKNCTEEEFGQMNLVLANNGLNGTIPPEIGLLFEVKNIFIEGEPALMGTISTTIAGLTDLSILAISGVGLSGTIPTEVGEMTSLEFISISFSRINGTLPSELGNLKALSNLFVESNEFSGSIPSELSGATLLREFSAYGNSLSGDVPTSLASLSRLDTITLGLNARIPEVLFSGMEGRLSGFVY